jgi:hypothetical protein
MCCEPYQLDLTHASIDAAIATTTSMAIAIATSTMAGDDNNLLRLN